MRTWLVAFALIVPGFFVARHLMISGPEHLEEIFGALFFLTLNFVTISTLGLFMSLAFKYWNRPTVLNRSLAASSYDIYLAHYPFVIGFQLVLLAVPNLPGPLKFTLVSGMSILCSYLVSHFVMRPSPRIAASLAFGLLMVMVLVIR